MSEKFKLRSISSKENYATYLALPLLEFSRHKFGTDNFLNAYITVNAQIGVLVRAIDAVPWNFWEHECYRTDMPLYDGILILFKPPKEFEQDMLHLLDSRYSKLSIQSLERIEDYSGLPINFPSKGEVITHRLIKAIRLDPNVRTELAGYLGATIPEDFELEPKLRDQDILYDVDTDITFIYTEYQKDQ